MSHYIEHEKEKEYLYFVVSFKQTILVINEEQFKKAPSLISVTDCGIVISLNEEQSLKTPILISVIFERRFTFLSIVHSLNAQSPILFTEDGIVISSKEEHLNFVFFQLFSETTNYFRESTNFFLQIFQKKISKFIQISFKVVTIFHDFHQILTFQV